MNDLHTITSMLTYRRPAGSQTEANFIDRFLMPLGVKKDLFGNHLLTIGDDPSVLWSSHTDSVHSTDGIQEVRYEHSERLLLLPPGSPSNCLGSDCAAGVWIMMEMIKAKVPGLYVFHAAEEIGCVGSRAIAKKTPHILSNIEAAIAFDRRDVASVITHQGQRCCSDAFGRSLAAQLPGTYKLDPTGILTDTKMYTDLIPECSNISVGYYNEHTKSEILDVKHLFSLRDHMVKINPDLFVIERSAKPKISTSSRSGLPWSAGRDDPQSIYDLVYSHPSYVAAFLENECGITFDEIQFYIEQSKEEQLSLF